MRKRAALAAVLVFIFLTASRILGNPYDFELERIFQERDPGILTEHLHRFELANPEVQGRSNPASRISDWIRRRFFRILPRSRTDELLKTVEETNRKYLYLDSEGTGSTGLDSAGDPLLRAEEGLYGAEGDLSLWEKEIIAERENLIAAWKDEAEAAARRWLAEAGLAGDNRFAAGLEEALSEAGEDAAGELERIYEQERSRFLFARLRDTFSLRKHTEGDLAEPEAEELLEEGIRESRALIEDLEAELHRWSGVEGSFLEAKNGWEAASRGMWRDLESGWNRRLGEYWRRKSEWNDEFRRLSSETTAVFEMKRRELLEERERASARLDEILAAERSGLERELKSVTTPLMESYRILESLAGDSGAEAVFGAEIRGSVRELESVIDSRNESYMNTFEHDLAAFRAVESHLREQLGIAEAVLKYAESDSSGRPRRSETLARYDSARLAYEESVSAMELFETRLSEAFTRVTETEALIDSLTEKAEAAREKSGEARAIYEERIEIYRLKDPVLLREMIDEASALRDAYLSEERDSYAEAYFEAMEGWLRSRLEAEREKCFEAFLTSRYGAGGPGLESLEAMAREAEGFEFDPADPPDEAALSGWAGKFAALGLTGLTEEVLSAYRTASGTPPGAERNYRFAAAAAAAGRLEERVILEYDTARVLHDMLFEAGGPHPENAAFKPPSEDELRRGAIELHLKRARFERAVFTGETGEAEDLDAGKVEAARDLTRLVYPELFARETSEAAAAELGEIIACLEACAEGACLSPALRSDVVLDFLDGRDYLSFRELNLADGFLADERREYNRKAVSALFAEEFAFLHPSSRRERTAFLQRETAELLEGLRGEGPEHRLVERLSSVLSLTASGELPGYVSDLLVLNAGLSLPESLLNGEQDRLGGETETLEGILLAAGREENTLQALAEMYRAGSGGAASALSTAAAYRVLTSGCTAEETLDLLYADIGPDIRPPVETVEEIARRLAKLFETADAGRYHPVLDGDPSDFADSIVPPGTSGMEKLLLEHRIRAGASGGALEGFLPAALGILFSETEKKLSDTRKKIGLMTKLTGIAGAKAVKEPGLIDGFFVAPESEMGDLLDEALAVWALPEGTLPGGTSEEARERGDIFFGREMRVLEAELRVRELGTDLDALSRGADTYYLEAVKPALLAYQEAAEECRRIDAEVRSLLRELEEHRTRQEALFAQREKALETLEAAGTELLTAEALYRYAREGYESDLYSPREDYERLLGEVEDMTRLTGILEDISPRSDALDAEYRRLAEEEIRALSLLDTVRVLEDELKRNSLDTERELDELHARLIEASGEVFTLPESIDYFGGAAEAAEKAPLTASAGESQLLWGFVRDFAALRDPAAWLRDAGLLLWKNLENGPSPVGLENNQMLDKLIELIEFDPEAYLTSRAGSVSKPLGDSVLLKKYSSLFEKEMFSPHPGFHDMDLTGMIVDTVKGRAETVAADFDGKATTCTAVGFFCLFTLNPVMAGISFGLAIDYADRAGKIRTLNEEVYAPSGASGRANFIERMSRIRRLQLRFLDTGETLDTLLTGGAHQGGMTRGGFESLLRLLGIPESPETEEALLDRFDRTAVEECGDPSALLGALYRGFDSDRKRLSAAAHEHGLELGAERMLLRNELKHLLESEVIDWDTLTAVCAGLYDSRRLDAEARIGYELELLDGFSPGSIEGKGALLEKKTALALELQELAGSRRRERLLRRSDLDQDLLMRRQRQAELRLRDVHDTGTKEWTAQYRRILQFREKQLEEFARAYEAGEKEWGRRWTRLLAGRNRAIENLLEGAPGDDGRGLPEDIGRAGVPLPGKETVEKTSYDYIFDTLHEERLDADAIFVPSPLPLGTPPSPRPSRRLIALDLTRRTDELTENLERHLLSVEASEADRIYGEFLTTLDERIGRANDEVDRRIASVLESSGYRRAGESFLRNSVVDKTLLGGTEKTRHSIEGYRRFSLPFRIPSPLEGLEKLMNVSSEAVRAALKRAGETLAAYSGLIFGSGNNPEPGPGEGKASAGHLAFFYRLRDSISRLVPDSVEAPDGLFAAHVGVPPEADEEDPEKFIHEGFGELGRIFTRYYRFELDLGRGLARLSQVWYDQRLWDDDADNDGEADTWFRAPTARGVIDFALDAVLNICIPGGGYLLSMADDFAFSLADVSAGRATFDEVLISLGAKMLTRFAGFGIDAFFGGFRETAGAVAANSFERISSAVLLEGTSTVLNNLSSGLIGGVSYTSGEGFGFDVEVLENYLYGRDAVSGYVSSGLGSAVTAGLEGIRIEIPKEWEILEGYDVGIDFGEIRGFNHTLGELVGAAGALAVTGGATLNVLNLRDVGRFFGAGELFPDQGVIELHLGGGPFLAIGGGGTDISVTALRSLIGGFGETVELVRTGKDVSRAYDIIEDMQSVTDRVIGRDEFRFSGGSGAAAVIAAVLESRRREISSGNLYELYADLTPASERHADENLMLAFAQGDVGAYEFLADRIFDSRGSFLLAHYLLREGFITLEDMVVTDKVYAGSEHTDGVVFGLREALLSEYFAEELAVAGEFLDGIIDPREYLTEKILAGKGRSLAEELAAIGEARIRELALYANLPGSDERALTGLLAAYTESLMAVRELGFRPPPSAPAAAGVLQSFAGPEGPLYAPVRDTDERGIRVTSGYGYRLIDESLRGVIAGEPYGWAEHEHRAVDIAVAPGGEYYAITDGTLGLVWDDNKGLGVELYIDGKDDRKFVYWHSDIGSVQDIGKVFINTGSSYIPAGTVIGRSGDTGASTGPHLHLEYHEDVNLKDPLTFLSKADYYSDPYAKYLSGYDQKYPYSSIVENIYKYGEYDSSFSAYTRGFQRKHMRELYKAEWERTVGSAF